MTKRKRDRQASKMPAPTATNVDWPVYVPSNDGTIQLEVGRARLRYGTLVVEFKDSGPANAIQNMIARGVLMGFGMVMVKPDVVNEMYQDVVENEEKIAEALVQGINSGLLKFNEEGKLEAVDGDQSPEEIVRALMNLEDIVVDKNLDNNLTIETNEEKN